MLYVLLILDLQNTYVLFNGLLQFLVYTKEKDAILFTYMPEVLICIYNEISVLMIDYVFAHLTYVLLETCVMMLMTSEDFIHDNGEEKLIITILLVDIYLVNSNTEVS